MIEVVKIPKSLRPTHNNPKMAVTPAVCLEM